MNKNLLQRGFTLIELMVVLGIMAVLTTISTISLTQVHSQTFASSSKDVLLSDIKSQQSRAMNGYTNKSTPQDYGVYFGNTFYTLFEGSTYDQNDPLNHIVTLDGQLDVSTSTFPDNQLVFEAGSGEIKNYQEENNQIIITDPQSGTAGVIYINKYGVFTEIN